MMTFPSVLLALMLALAYGALYHLIRGGGFWRLMYFLGLSFGGFAAGHIIGLWRGWQVFPLGSVNLGLSSIGSLLALLLGDWLGRVGPDRESTV
jgi:hypothetical protein